MPAPIRHNPPRTWKLDTRSGEVACPHRDLCVCPECAAENAEVVDVYGMHYWIGDPADRAQFEGMAA